MDCNDEGIPYVESHVKCELSELRSEVLYNPVPGELVSKFMPFELGNVANKFPPGVHLNIYLNVRGGISIRHCINCSQCHKLGMEMQYLMNFKFSKIRAAIDQAKIEAPGVYSVKLFPVPTKGLYCL